MARKLNVPKLPRHNNGGSQTPNRRSAPPVAALYLMRLREQGVKIAPQARPVRLAIEEEIGQDTPEPVKITKID